MTTHLINPLQVTLVCDGGSLGNPGPCYGSWRVSVNGVPWVAVSRQQFGEGTNNEAEYDALLGGLRHIVNLFSGTVLSDIELCIKMDSELVVHQVVGTWKCKAENLRSKLSHAKALLARFGGWHFHKVPREQIEEVLGH